MSLLDRILRRPERTEAGDTLDRDARTIYPEWYVPNTGSGTDLPTMLLEEGVRHPLVSACRRMIFRAISEAPLRWVDDEGVRQPDQIVPQGVDELETVLRRPSRRYTQRMMVGSLGQDLVTYGNTFQPIVFGNDGMPLGMGYISPMHCTPIMNRRVMRIDGYRVPLENQSAAATFASTLWGTRYLAAQALQPSIDPNSEGDFLPEQMIHMMLSPSSLNPQVGHSALDDILPLLAEDNEWTGYSAWQAVNRARMGGIVSPKEDTQGGLVIEPEQLEKVQSDIGTMTTGRNRGGILALPYGVDFKQITAAPSYSEINAQHANADIRVPMAFGIHPSLLPTQAGMMHSPLSDANIRAVRDFFTETVLIPMWKQIEEQLTIYLGDLFVTEGRLEFDLGDVRALAVDRTVEAKRTIELLMAGLLTYNQAMKELGYEDIGEAGEYRVASTSHEVIPADGLGDLAEETSADAQAAIQMVGGVPPTEEAQIRELPQQAGGSAAG